MNVITIVYFYKLYFTEKEYINVLYVLSYCVLFETECIYFRMLTYWLNTLGSIKGNALLSSI